MKKQNWLKEKLTNEEFIKRSKEKHKNKYDYSLVEYKNTNSKVKIICPEHGVFEQSPYGHTFGYGCKKCANLKSSLTMENFIEKSKKIYGDIFDYSLVDYKNSKIKVKIICPKHGVFERLPYNHLKGYGCGPCNRLDKFIKKSKIKHKNKYDYSLVELENNKKIKIICPKHGIFEQSHRSHSSGVGCPNCAGNKKKTTEEFIEEAKNTHGDFYDYSLVEYKNTNSKVKIICPEHGVFEETAKEHIFGHGCSKCKGLFKYTTQTFIEKSKLKHDNRYDYSLVNYINSQTRVKIICPEHGIFNILPAKHIWGDSCPKCANSLGFGKSWMKNCIKQNRKTYLYFIRLFNENENFIKIGVSTRKNNGRFNGIKLESGYDFEIIKINMMEPDESYNLEQKIINDFKHLQYVPKIYFGGRNECFCLEILNYLDKKLL